MDDKVKSKIRKLLALAQSDNEHEAERARAQAKSLMSRHGVSSDDVEIAEIHGGQSFSRKNAKTSEIILLSAIRHISGCESYLRNNIKYPNGKARYATTPVFMGPQPDAEIAAYCWDVLFSQLVCMQKAYKKNAQANANEVEIYSIGWAGNASKKLVNAFGHKDIKPATTKHIEEKSKGMGAARILKTKSTGDGCLDKQLLARGGVDGDKANLHAATPNARKHEKRLTGLSKC